MPRKVVPSRHSTLMGMPAFAGKVAEAEEDPSVLLRYPCTLYARGWAIKAIIVSYLELEDYLLMKGFSLISLDGPIDLALPNERSKFG
jgi:hypothetical protein